MSTFGSYSTGLVMIDGRDRGKYTNRSMLPNSVTWWLIPRIVSGLYPSFLSGLTLLLPNYKWDINN